MQRAELVLASRSPQRRAILEQLGVRFRVQPADVEEMTAGDPRELVLENARRKAAAVAGDLVLGADTVVALDGRVYGKPDSEEEAAATLRRLSGTTHEVWGGIALAGEVACSVTEVRFRELGDRDIEWYLETGEWRDRAGAYAIQGRGAAIVAGITGDYWNVVGLSVHELVRIAPQLVGISTL